MAERFDITPADYLAAFSTPAGRRVLQHLLYEGHLYEEVVTEEETIERNFVTRILRNLGAFSSKESRRMITAALLDAGAVGNTNTPKEKE